MVFWRLVIWPWGTDGVFDWGWVFGSGTCVRRNQGMCVFMRKFDHDGVIPDWLTMSYNDMVNWRAKRVVTDNNFAYAFNWLCEGARSEAGYSHETDPLPWMRDCSDPLEEVDASARYNVDVLTTHRPASEEGEEDLMRAMISDVNGRSHRGFGPSSECCQPWLIAFARPIG